MATVLAQPTTGAAGGSGWLLNRSFDLNFIVAIAAIAILSGVAVVLEPRLLAPIIFIDIWVLGYHHVISTYTRLCFDRESFGANRFYFVWLPILVAAGVALLAFGTGIWALTTLYFYWQWFHYARQSWGVTQAYRRKSFGSARENETLSQLVFYLVPLWGILHRSHQDPGTFLGLELKMLPVSQVAVDVVGMAALAGIFWWLWTRLRMARAGVLPVSHTLYVVSHHAVFYVAYVLIENVDAGWLVVNIWHNAQYIVFVWMFNNYRYRDGIDPKAKFLSTISQTGNWGRYVFVCLALSTLVYLGIMGVVGLLPALGIVYMVVVFHHYIVDGLIWKVRHDSVQRNLGIATPGGG